MRHRYTRCKHISAFFGYLILLLATATISANALANPRIVEPAEGSTLSSSTHLFSWTSDGTQDGALDGLLDGLQIDQWWLYVGTTVGARDIANSGNLGTDTEYEVIGIPVDGSNVYARLWYYSSSQWRYIDSTYTAAELDLEIDTPAIISPTNSSEFASSSVDFEWRDNNTLVNFWWLHIGSLKGGKDFYDSGTGLRNRTSVTVDQLPVDGSTVFVRLWYHTSADGWQFTDTTYRSTDGSADGGDAPGRYVGTKSDPWIPNFAHPDVAAGPVIKTRQPGDWSDPATWGGIVPGSGNVAVVEHAVELSGNVQVLDVVIYPNGFLRFPPDASIQLNVGTLQVLAGGKLEIGRPSNPISSNAVAEIVFADRAIDLNLDPGQYGQGLLVLGDVSISGTPVDANFVRLSAEPRAGDVTLSTSQPLEGWRAGDRIVLPDSRQVDPRIDRGFVSQTEVLEIADVSNATGVITLANPVSFNHPGARGADGELDLLPHAARLSGNVVLRSADANGVRGHAQFMHRASVDIRHALFKDLGRTTARELDDTEFDERGNAVRIGTNQSGRYPIHAHHLTGPEVPADHGFQYVFIGNSIDGGSFDHAFKWGIAVHASHYGQLLRNTVYNYAGSGIATEDGSETGNVFDLNFVARTAAFGPLDVNDRGTAGTAFWFRGQNNMMNRNVAADSRNSGFSINAYRLGDVKIPDKQGSTDRVTVDMNTLPILSFSDNETYGPAFFGVDLWEIGSTGDTLHDVERSIVDDLRIWHHYYQALDIYRTHRITFNDVMIRGDAPQLNNRYTNPTGMNLSDPYRSRSFVINQADIQGQRTGIHLDFSGVPQETVGEFFDQPSPQTGTFETTIQKSVLKNYTNLRIETRRNLGSPRRTVVCDTSFETVNVDLNGQRAQPFDILRAYNFSNDRNLVSPDSVDIYNYNSSPAADFAVFSAEQDPNFIVPKSSDNGRQIGSPVDGLTNQQNRAQYGIAVADELAPCFTTTEYPKVAGFTCPLNVNNANDSRPTIPAMVFVDQQQACRGDVRLSWESSCDDDAVTDYIITRDGADIGQTSGTAFQDSGLAPGTYVYKIRSRDVTGFDSLPSTLTVDVPEQCAG